MRADHWCLAIEYNDRTARQLLVLVLPMCIAQFGNTNGKRLAMRYATSNEIEYLGDIEGATAKNPRLIRDMAQRLDALRRFDQSFCDADCRPHTSATRWQPDSPTKTS
jgi:hypothetical protein